MKKHHAMVAFISITCCVQDIFTCPCTASNTDQRPFFEQYEPESTNATQKNKQEEQVTNIEEVNS